MGKMMMENILASHIHQFFYLVCSFLWFLFQVLNTEISLEDASGKTKLAVDVFSKSLWFLKRVGNPQLITL
jgi:hypothetical protein